jgi:hypothetical protein
MEPKVREKFNQKEITTMKTRNLFMNILGIFIALILAGTVAPAATIEVIETFDYPGPGNLTLPQKINDTRVVVGIVVDAAGVTRGFLRNRNGVFSDAWVEPNDTGNFTTGRGINNSRLVCGEYLNGADGTFHGYFRRAHANFIEFDITDATNTIPLGINNAGDFVGTAIFTDGSQPAFVSLDENITLFSVPDATATLAYSINASEQSVGYYVDAAAVLHGYLRDSDGTLTFPIDPPDSVGTVLFGNNDSNWVVGRWADSAGVTHGLFFITPDDFVTFDYPGSAFTSLNGINQDGYICGRYVDAAGIAHGFLAKVNFSETANSNRTNLPAPVKPVRPTLEASRPGAPAF